MYADRLGYNIAYYQKRWGNVVNGLFLFTQDIFPLSYMCYPELARDGMMYSQSNGEEMLRGPHQWNIPVIC